MSSEALLSSTGLVLPPAKVLEPEILCCAARGGIAEWYMGALHPSSQGRLSKEEKTEFLVIRK